jgi:hypothetical protein
MKTTIYCLIIGLLLATPVSAEIFNVTISSQLAPDSDTDPVFGFTEPFTVTFTMRINTGIGFDVYLPSSEWLGPDLYGYQAGAITMDPLVVGTATFLKSDIQEMIAAPGYSASIWFDAPLSHEMPQPNIWLVLVRNDDPQHELSFGTIVCGATDCNWEQNAYASDYDSGYDADDFEGSSFTVQATKAADPQSIPTLSEWGMIVMSLVLAGSAFWMIRRRQEA